MLTLSRWWQRIVRLVRGPEPPPPASFDADRDPVVRGLRYEQRLSERRMRDNAPIRRASWPERTVFPPRHPEGERPCDA